MSGVSSSQDVDIDLARLFQAIWKRRYRVVVYSVGAAALALLGTSLIAPEYRSETQILIELRSPEFTTGDNNGTASSDPVLDELGVTSQVQLLQSSDLVKQVARDMKLYELEEFDPAANPSIVDTLAITFGLMKNPLTIPPEERILKEFMKKLTVYQVEKSRVIGIQFSSEDPKLAAAIPNHIADVYLSLQRGAKLDTNTEAARWLEPEIANLREKVRIAEGKVAAYRATHDLLRIGSEQTFSDQQLNDISAELARVRGERANAEARSESVRQALSSGAPTDALVEVVGSPTIQSLKQQEAQIQGQVSDLSTSLLEGHPRLKGLRGQLAGVRKQIRIETQKILQSLESEAKVARLRERQLVSQLDSLKADSARAGEQEVDLKDLERDAAAQRDLLETYLGRYREATSRIGNDATPADARIISNAVEPSEVNFPKKLPITIVAGLAAFLIYSVVIMLGELFSGRGWKNTAAVISNENEVVTERKNAPEAGPRAREAVRDRAGADAPKRRRWLKRSENVASDEAAEAPTVAERRGIEVPKMESLLSAYSTAPEETAAPRASRVDRDSEFSFTAVAHFLAETDAGFAICVSPDGDSGSAASVLLARAMASKGRRTVLIDLTGSAYPTRLMAQSPRLAGITDILMGGVQIAASIHGDRLSDAHIIPQGNSDPVRAMRGADRLPMILDALGEAYDCVIVECGPVDVAGVQRLARNLDTEIILSAPGVDEEELMDFIAQFADAGFEELVLMTAPLGSHPGGAPNWKVA